MTSPVNCLVATNNDIYIEKNSNIGQVKETLKVQSRQQGLSARNLNPEGPLESYYFFFLSGVARVFDCDYDDWTIDNGLSTIMAE